MRQFARALKRERDAFVTKTKPGAQHSQHRHDASIERMQNVQQRRCDARHTIDPVHVPHENRVRQLRRISSPHPGDKLRLI
jgi:hypothetical protein